MYFQDRFVYKGDQSESRVDQDRTRRALSNGLLIFFTRPPITGEKPKLLSKRPEKPFHFRKTLSDSFIKGTRVD
jgi:hypothetical protein